MTDESQMRESVDANDGQPIDFRAVDPTRDDEWLSLELRRIVQEAQFGRGRAMLAVLSSWSWPTLVAATLVLGIGLRLARVADAGPHSIGATNKQILGLPAPLVRLVRTTREPTMSDLATALGAGVPHAR